MKQVQERSAYQIAEYRNLDHAHERIPPFESGRPPAKAREVRGPAPRDNYQDQVYPEAHESMFPQRLEINTVRRIGQHARHWTVARKNLRQCRLESRSEYRIGQRHVPK